MLGLPGCRTFSLEELVDITRNFDNSALLGEGSYGKVWFQFRTCYMIVLSLMCT